MYSCKLCYVHVYVVFFCTVYAYHCHWLPSFDLFSHLIFRLLFITIHFSFPVAIADEAERCAGELLVPDNGCHYDQLVEINLDEVSVGGSPINWGFCFA